MAIEGGAFHIRLVLQIICCAKLLKFPDLRMVFADFSTPTCHFLYDNPKFVQKLCTLLFCLCKNYYFCNH